MDEIIKQINQIIQRIGYRNLIIIGIGIVVLVLVLILYRVFRLRKYRKLIVEVENRMSATKSLPLQYRLGRVENIAANMPDVAELYEEYAKEFEDICDFQKNELGVLANEVDEQLFYGKMRKVSGKMKKLLEMIDIYETRSQDLLDKIEKITKIENEQRIEIIRVKEKYRGVIDHYESIRFKVEDYVPSLQDYFNEIDDDFGSLESMMNHQQFEEAKKFTQDIEVKIDWVDDIMKDLPSYIAVVRRYIPKKLTYIEDVIKDMLNEDFSLNQLDVDNRLKVMHATLDGAIKHIKKLQLDNTGEVLQNLVDSIDQLIKDLEVEKNAYNEFKEKWESSYTLITQIYEQYKEALNDFNQVCHLYVVSDLHLTIDKTYQEFDQILKESYDLEEEMKEGHFSYSVMIGKVAELKEKAVVHQEYLTDFFAIRDQLYMQEQRAIGELENINIVLLEIKSEIKNRHLPMINDSYKDYIQTSYDKAAQIQAFCQNKPVELKELSKRVDEVRDVIYKLYDNVHNLIVTAAMVEEAIVFGNRYRSTFLEVNTELTKTEVLFRNGEYTKALSTAVDIIEKIKPGSYKALIDKRTEGSV